MIKPYIYLLLFACNFLSCKAQDSTTYKELVTELESKRTLLKNAYDSGNKAKKEEILHETEEYVFNKITINYFNFWYNTPWDFNGTTRTPKEGKVACGYFVTGVLFDAGFNIPRADWARLPSETFIRKLSSEIKRFSDRPISEVKEYLNETGDGLYLVGLDAHVGFIYKKGTTIKFVHSSYYHPTTGVMAEDIDTVNPLNDSKYRVIGKLLDHEQMEKWLLKEKIE